jgi:DNA-directed RNA polymerase subunit RPC12/RpoP
MNKRNDTEIKKEIARRIFLAEKRGERKQFKKTEIKWLKTVCIKCGKKVEYYLKENFRGQIQCPHCRQLFKIPSLDDYLKRNLDIKFMCKRF